MFDAQMVEWLAGEEGRKVLQRAEGLDFQKVGDVERLRRSCTARQAHAVIELVEARRRGAAKFSRADRMYFDRVGLEQSTGQVVARYKARRFAGFESVADLCCGVGGDLLGLAGQAPMVVGVDRQLSRLMMARLNAEAYGVGDRVRVVCGDVRRMSVDCEAFHLDPDRRSGGRRVVQLSQMEPGIEFIEQLLQRTRDGAIKVSAAVSYRQLPWDCEVEIISCAGQCKQAVFWFGRLASCHRRATVLPSGASIDDSWVTRREVADIDRYLFDPDPAVSRADLLGQLAGRFDLSFVAPGATCLTGPTPRHSDFFQCFEVDEIMAWHEDKVRRYLSQVGVGLVAVKPRGVKLDVDSLSRRLRGAGEKDRVVFVLRVGRKVLAVVGQKAGEKAKGG